MTINAETTYDERDLLIKAIIVGQIAGSVVTGRYYQDLCQHCGKRGTYRRAFGGSAGGSCVEFGRRSFLCPACCDRFLALNRLNNVRARLWRKYLYVALSSFLARLVDPIWDHGGISIPSSKVSPIGSWIGHKKLWCDVWQRRWRSRLKGVLLGQRSYTFYMARQKRRICELCESRFRPTLEELKVTDASYWLCSRCTQRLVDQGKDASVEVDWRRRYDLLNDKYDVDQLRDLLGYDECRRLGLTGLAEEDLETDQPCPYCDEVGDECPHLLGLLDLTFASCEAGFSYGRDHEFDSLIHAAFSKHLIGGKPDGVVWGDPGVQELWEGVPDDFVLDPADGDSYVEIDKYRLIRFIGQLFDAAGACCHFGVDDCGLPGLTSSVEMYFVDDPEQAFNKALADLGKRLVEPAKAEGPTSLPPPQKEESSVRPKQD